jgi:hypothetical protein
LPFCLLHMCNTLANYNIWFLILDKFSSFVSNMHTNAKIEYHIAPLKVKRLVKLHLIENKLHCPANGHNHGQNSA